MMATTCGPAAVTLCSLSNVTSALQTPYAILCVVFNSASTTLLSEPQAFTVSGVAQSTLAGVLDCRLFCVGSVTSVGAYI